MSRFTIDSIIATGGTNRVSIWKAYFDYYFPSHWLFGIGFDPLNMYYAIEKYLKIGHGAHNLIIDIISVSGMFGLIIF